MCIYQQTEVSIFRVLVQKLLSICYISSLDMYESDTSMCICQIVEFKVDLFVVGSRVLLCHLQTKTRRHLQSMLPMERFTNSKVVMFFEPGDSFLPVFLMSD